MPITRGQMKRQLYMRGGIMDIVPREQALLGGIKKAAKKAVKGVKKIAKSPIGKAALLYAGTAGLGALGAKLGSGVTGSGFGLLKPGNVLANLGASKAFLADKFLGPQMVDTGGEVFRKGTPFSKFLGIGDGKMGNIGKLATLGVVSTFLTKTLGMPEEQAEAELARDPSKYLELYYRNLNPNATEEEVIEFVTTNTSEYAAGGRVGFANGDEVIEEEGLPMLRTMPEFKGDEVRPVDMMMAGPVLPPDPTQPVNPFGPKPGDFGIEEDIPIKMASNLENDKILEALFEKYLDMGLSPKDAAKAAQEEFDRMSKRKMESTRGVAALGGRIGFDEGTDEKIKMIKDMLSRGADDDTIMTITGASQAEIDQIKNSKAMGGRMGFDKGTKKRGLQSLMEEEQRLPSILDELDDDDDYGDKIVILTYDKFGRSQLKLVPKSEAMPEGAVDIPRRGKAKGDTASMNAMQAAGVEGLPVRQNPKGVKELDLRKIGGFIPPVGIKEKADDIPAMLSNNEFVFTADAVRGAGGGDVNLGAQRMYDTMKRLEAGGKA
jgi:hypothetical protein